MIAPALGLRRTAARVRLGDARRPSLGALPGGATLEERKREEGEAGGSWLREVSPVTLIVMAVTVLAVIGYGLLLIVEMFL